MSESKKPRLIERVWRREGIAGALLHLGLRPASAGFAVAVRLRALAFRLHLRRRRTLSAAVVSVGNLSVGGTGKTPTALWVAEELSSRGYSVAILSRGYGGTARQPTLVAARGPEGVAANADWQTVGDETVLLARRFAGPVVVARRRAEAGRLACEHLGANVLVLDDGFQHLALARDFDLVCLRADEGDDRAVLPAGRLREPPSALRRADAVLVTKGEDGEPVDPRLERRAGDRPLFRGQLRVRSLVTPGGDGEGWLELPLGSLAERRSLVVTGVADPGPFYRTLHEWDARTDDFLEFPDHHAYTLADWKKIAYRGRNYDLVVTTEKDLVKLERFPFAKNKLVAVRAVMEVEEGGRLIESIVDAVEKKLGSSAGRVPAEVRS